MAERTLIYTDYEPPRIYLKEPLRFSPNNISAKMEQLDVAATDVIDGDLTNRMRISYDIYDKIPSGEYEVVLQVNNSAGDTCIVPLKATVLDLAEENGKIYPALSDYIVYTQIGQELEAEAFLLGVTSGDLAYPFGEEEGEITVQDIQIRSEVNYEKEGVYTMDYSYTSPEDITATTTLYVVVEEK